MDSQGNRYNGTGAYSSVYTGSYNTASATAGSNSDGDATTVAFDSSRSDTVTYDAWGRVVKVASTPSGTGGPNGSASYTTFSYDALGRQISTTNVATSGSIISGTLVYFDGTNRIEVRLANNSPLMTYVWSPADGRMILRDAVAAP